MLRSEQVRASSSGILARLSNVISSWPTAVEFAVELAPWHEEDGLGDRAHRFFSLAPGLITMAGQVHLSGDAPDEAPVAEMEDVNMKDAQGEEADGEEEEANAEEEEADGEEEEEEVGGEEGDAAYLNGIQLVSVLTDDGRVVRYMPLAKDVLAQAFGWTGDDVERGHQYVSNRCKLERLVNHPLRHPIIMGDPDCPWQNVARQELYAGMVALAGKLARFISVVDVRAMVRDFHPH